MHFVTSLKRSKTSSAPAYRFLPTCIQRLLPATPAVASNWGLVGTPDFVLHNHRGTYSVTAVVEIKTPWKVTPQQIDSSFGWYWFGTVVANIPRDCPGQWGACGTTRCRTVIRLHGPQSQRWGLLSTVDGWCFAYREDGSSLLHDPYVRTRHSRGISFSWERIHTHDGALLFHCSGRSRAKLD